MLCDYQMWWLTSSIQHFGVPTLIFQPIKYSCRRAWRVPGAVCTLTNTFSGCWCINKDTATLSLAMNWILYYLWGRVLLPHSWSRFYLENIKIVEVYYMLKLQRVITQLFYLVLHLKYISVFKLIKLQIM